jgi:Raf kinase inhibitor-like YbhB/YbcL family protein
MRIFASALLIVFGFSSHAANLVVKSSALKAGGPISNAQVFNGMGCKGQNISPDLSWSGAPNDTKAFAISVYDPDAPTGSGWWHWLAINIPSTVTSVAAGASGNMPAGTVEARTDFGKPGYGGPCPPVGDQPHHYIFKVFALKGTIPLDKDSSGAMVGFYVNSMKIAEGSLTATYGRTK